MADLIANGYADEAAAEAAAEEARRLARAPHGQQPAQEST